MNCNPPSQIVQRRIDLLAAEGVIFKTNCDIGKDITANQIMDEFDAILLAVGSMCPRDLSLPGKVLFIWHIPRQQLKWTETKHSALQDDIPSFIEDDIAYLSFVVEGRHLHGIHFAMEYLELSQKHQIGSYSWMQKLDAKRKHVIIIGGGDTGVDCIATAVRQVRCYFY